MGGSVRALRGATTVDADTVEQVNERVQTLIERMLERNGIEKDDLISILFTATDDIHSVFPATAGTRSGRSGHSNCAPSTWCAPTPRRRSLLSPPPSASCRKKPARRSPAVASSPTSAR